MFLNICKRKQKKNIRVHDFRHSCATLLIHNGADISLVSKWLGHSNISTTYNVYVHVYESDFQKMVNVLDKF